MKYVTIASDISSDPRYKVNTWACYIRYGGGVIKKTGRFKEFYKNTAEAETYALINALTIAKKNIPDWKDSKVIIYNEIEHALDPVRTKAGNIRRRDAVRSEAIESVAMPILREALEWERRKIKAHFKNWQQSSNPAKYAINRWCDIQSSAEMKKFRREVKSK